MTQGEFNRYYALAEKVIDSDVTEEELKEFQYLLEIWNASTQYNLMRFQKHGATTWKNRRPPYSNTGVKYFAARFQTYTFSAQQNQTLTVQKILINSSYCV